MNDNPTLKFQDYFAIISRRKWYLIVSAALGLLGALVALEYLPRSYRASALIVVEPPVVSADLVKTVGGGAMEDRIDLLRQEIMSRKFLEPILREFDLWGAATAPAEGIEALVESFRHYIGVTTSTGQSGGGRSIISFTVSFEGPEPQMAMNVTNKIAELFVAQHQQSVSVQVQGTSTFLDAQLSSLRMTLEKQEALISDFRRQHMGELPEQLSFNLQAQERARQDLKQTAENLETAVEKRASLEKLLLEGKEGDTVAGRLAELKRQLSQLRTRYKESYPDVYITKRQIEQLEGLLRDGVANPEDPAVLPGKGGEGIQTQMRELDLAIDALKRKKQSLDTQILDFDRRIIDTPRREQDLMILMRDYDNLKKNYQSLLDKQLNASLSKTIESERSGGLLRIIDPAYLPARPFRPDPGRVLLIGILLGLGCGAGIVFLLEYGDTAFRRPDDLEQTLGLPVLAVVPDYPKSAAISRRMPESVLK